MDRAKKMLFRKRIDLALFISGIIHISVPLLIHDHKAGDYAHFIKTPIDLSFGFDRWFTWSSRLFIESSVNIFSKYMWAWVLITLLASGVIFWSLGRILNIKKGWQAGLLLTLSLFINNQMYASAGIFANTINYLWPGACFIFVLAIILKPFKNKKAKITSNIILWPAIIFAVCSEQLSVLGVIIFVAMILRNIVQKKRVSKIVIILALISLLGVINVLVAPGNAVRKEAEIRANWADYRQVSVEHKISVGASVTFARLFATPENLAILLVVGLSVLAYKKNNMNALFCIAPVLALCIMMFFPITNHPSSSVMMANWFNYMREHTALMDVKTGASLTKDDIRFYVLMLAACFSGIISSMYLIYGKTKKGLEMIFIVLAGLAISMTVSFSPTIFASSTRTMEFFVFILLGVNYVIYNDILSIRRIDL